MAIGVLAAAFGITAIEDIIKRVVRAGVVATAGVITTKSLEGINYDWLTESLGVPTRGRKEEEIERARRFIRTIQEVNKQQILVSNTIGALDPQIGRMVRDSYGAYIWSLGLGWLSWVALSPFLSEAVAAPLQRLYRKEFRNLRITRSLIERALKVGMISEDEARNRLAEMGYPDEDIDIILAMTRGEKRESTRDLARTSIVQA